MRKIFYKIIAPLTKIYWFIFRPKTYGVKCVVKCGNEVLMIKNSYGSWKSWMFPGGGIDKDESAEEAVKREVMEEVGIEIIDFQKIGEYTSAKEYKRDTVTVFMAKVNSKEFKIDHSEISQASWFDLNNLPIDISDYFKNILNMINTSR